MSGQTSSYSDSSFDRNITNLGTNLGELEKLDPNDLVYYNATDKKIQAVGGDAIQTLRLYERRALDATRLSTVIPYSYLTGGIQRVAGLFQQQTGLGQYVTDLKRDIDTTVKQALEAAGKADNKKSLEEIKQKIDVLNERLKSSKLQGVFQSIIRVNSAAESDIRSLTSQMNAAAKELKLASLFFSPVTPGKSVSRLETLKNIAEKGGSIQAYDVLTYEEYEAIQEVMHKAALHQPLSPNEQKLKDNLPPTVAGSFQKALQALKKRTETFKEKYPQFQQPQVREKVLMALKEIKEIDSAMVQLKKDREAHRLPEAEYEQKVSELKTRKEALKPTLEMIVGAKNFMRTVMSEEGEGSWLDVYSFIKSGDSSHRDLADIDALSIHQSLELDDMINQTLMNEHLANKPKGGHPPLKAVIEGAGPNGLFSALQLFLAGTHVTVVNDRGERYVRNQIVDLDPKWTAQLRFFMGTKFDELFIGENAIGRFVEDGHYIQINTKNLEDALKERMTEISACAAKQQPESPPLALFYESAFKEVQFPKEGSAGYKAKLEVPARPSPDTIRYNQALIDAKAARLLNTKYAGQELGSLPDSASSQTVLERAYDEAKEELLNEKTEYVLKYLQEKFNRPIGPDEALIDSPAAPVGPTAPVVTPIAPVPTGPVAPSAPDESRKSKKITAREQAALELAGKASELRTPREVSFDFLVCCGGASDPIRNKYLGMPKEETLAKSYGVAVFNKGDRFKNAHFLPPGREGRIFETMETLKPHLEKQKFDALIAGSTFLSEDFRKKYQNLTERILRGLVEDPVATLAANGETQYAKDADGNYVLGDENFKQKEIQLRVFENKLTFYTGAETPEGLSEFLKDLEKEKRRLPQGSPKAGLYDALKAQVDKKWFAAIAYKFMTDGHSENADIIHMGPTQDPSKINFDPFPINTSTFPVVQYAVENAAKELSYQNCSLIVTALGDARASPHFYSGSGMSTGRVGIENTALLVRDFHGGKLNKEELVSQLATRLDNVKLQVLEKGKHFVKRSPPQKRDFVALSKMCDTVNETCKALSQATVRAEPAFSIIRDQEVCPEYRKFKLEVVRAEGENILVEAEVTSKGEIFCNGKAFHTILDAVIAVKQK